MQGWALGAGRLGEVIHPCDGGLAEEAVLVVHQVLVDAGSGMGGKKSVSTPESQMLWGAGASGSYSYSLAGLVGAGPEDGRDGVCVADGAQVLLAGGLWGTGGWLAEAHAAGGQLMPGLQPSPEQQSRAWGWERRTLTSVVAAACLDSSLRWLSIVSTLDSSSALMYSVSAGTEPESYVCAEWLPIAGAASCPVLPPGPAAPCPSPVQHSHVLREKWRFSVAAAAAAMAAGSACPSRYWMERSWKQGSASSTAVARSALQRDRHGQALPLCPHVPRHGPDSAPAPRSWPALQELCPRQMQHGGRPQSSGAPSTHQGS